MPHERGRRISQEVLSRKLGVHWVTVSAWERGKATPTLENLARIADVTGRPVTYFLDEGEDDEEAALRQIVDAFTGLLVSRVREAREHERVSA